MEIIWFSIHRAMGGGVHFNNNNSEMLRIYKNSNTNYIGNGSNNFIINTNKGAI